MSAGQFFRQAAGQISLHCILCTQNHGDKGRLGSKCAGNRRQFQMGERRLNVGRDCPGIPVAWQGVEAAADDLAARVKVKRWPPPAALIPTTQPAHQLHGHSDHLTPLLFLNFLLWTFSANILNCILHTYQPLPKAFNQLLCQ